MNNTRAWRRTLACCLLTVMTASCGGGDHAAETLPAGFGSPDAWNVPMPEVAAPQSARSGEVDIGACCFGDDCLAPGDMLCCEPRGRDACAHDGGAFMGSGTLCSDAPCVALVTLDSDNDGRPDIEEVELGLDPEDPLDGPDIDGDGIDNALDDDVDGDGIPNIADADIDGDGIENPFDDDDDGDGIPDDEDDDDDADGEPDNDDSCNFDNECPSEAVCRDDKCVKQCIDSYECRDLEKFVCRERACTERCEDDEGCSTDQQCYDNYCVDTCIQDTDCGFREVCQTGQCIPGCNRDSDCGSTGRVCDRFRLACVECLQDSDCAIRDRVCDRTRGQCVVALDEQADDDDPGEDTGDESEDDTDDSEEDSSESDSAGDGSGSESEDASEEDASSEEEEQDPPDGSGAEDEDDG